MGSFWSDFLTFAGSLSAVAFVAFVAFVWRMGTDRALFARLRKDVPDEDTEAHPWLKWVNQTVRRLDAPVPWTRDDVMKKYDAVVAGLLSYQVLQRFPIIAPLCGVLITVWKFTSFRAVAGEDLGALVQAVAGPLFVGVGSGAAAALAGQVFAMLAGWRLAAARQAAADWFDRHVWPDQAKPGGAGVGDEWADVATEFTRQLKRATRRFNRTTGGWLAATTNLKSATQALIDRADQAAREFTAVVHGINTSVQPLQKAADSLGQSGDLVHKTFTAAAGLERAVTQLTPTVANLSTAVTTIAAQATTLKTATDSLKVAADAVSRDLPSATATLTQQATTAVKQFNETSAAVARAVEPLNEAARSLRGGGGQIAALGITLDKLRTAIEDKLTPGSQAVADAGTALKANVEALKQPVTQFATASTSFGGDARKLTDSVAVLTEAGQKLKTAAGALSDFAEKSVDPLKDGCKDLSGLLAECRSVAAELGKLPELHKELKPLLATLTEAGRAATAASAVPAQIDAATGKALERMTAALGETTRSLKTAADQSADSLRGLPEQFKRSLGDFRDGVRDHAVEFVDRLEAFLEQAVVRKAKGGRS